MSKRKAEALRGVRLDTGDEDYLMSAHREGRKVAGLARTDDGNWIAAWYRKRGVSGRAAGKTPRSALEKAVESALQMDFQEFEVPREPYARALRPAGTILEDEDEEVLFCL